MNILFRVRPNNWINGPGPNYSRDGNIKRKEYFYSDNQTGYNLIDPFFSHQQIVAAAISFPVNAD